MNDRLDEIAAGEGDRFSTGWSLAAAASIFSTDFPFWIFITILGSIDLAWLHHASVHMAGRPIKAFMLLLCYYIVIAWLLPSGAAKFR